MKLFGRLRGKRNGECPSPEAPPYVQYYYDMVWGIVWSMSMQGRYNYSDTIPIILNQFKRIEIKSGIHEVTQDEFEKLLSIFQQMGVRYPGFLSLNSVIQYDAAPQTVIGSHTLSALPLENEFRGPVKKIVKGVIESWGKREEPRLPNQAL